MSGPAGSLKHLLNIPWTIINRTLPTPRVCNNPKKPAGIRTDDIHMTAFALPGVQGQTGPDVILLLLAETYKEIFKHSIRERQHATFNILLKWSITRRTKGLVHRIMKTFWRLEQSLHWKLSWTDLYHGTGASAKIPEVKCNKIVLLCKFKWQIVNVSYTVLERRSHSHFTL